MLIDVTTATSAELEAAAHRWRQEERFKEIESFSEAQQRAEYDRVHSEILLDQALRDLKPVVEDLREEKSRVTQDLQAALARAADYVTGDEDSPAILARFDRRVSRAEEKRRAERKAEQDLDQMIRSAIAVHGYDATKARFPHLVREEHRPLFHTPPAPRQRLFT